MTKTLAGGPPMLIKMIPSNWVRIEARSPYSVYKAAGRAVIGIGSAAAKNGLAGPCSSYVCRRRSPMKLPRNFFKPLAIGATAQ
jgi:hypothetical protein